MCGVLAEGHTGRHARARRARTRSRAWVRTRACAIRPHARTHAGAHAGPNLAQILDGGHN